MGIDLTKLRRKSQTGDDVVKKILDDVFKEENPEQKPITDTTRLQEEKKLQADSLTGQEVGKQQTEAKTDVPELMPDGSRYTGYMYYNGRKMKVGDRVDQDGNTFVVDEHDNLYQVKAKDLKPDNDLPKPSDVLPEKLEVKNPAEEQTGFWHTYLGDLIERLGAGASDLSGNIYGLLDMADKYVIQPLNPINKLVNDYLKRKYESEHPGEEYKSPLQRQEESAHNYANTLRSRSDRYGGKDYEQLWDEDRYGDMVGEVFLTASESAPQSAIAMAGGPIGLTLTGATAARQKYYQLDNTPETKDMPEAMKVFNSVATGTFEYFSEKIGDVKIGQHLKQLYKKVGKEAGEKLVEDEVSAWFTKMFKKYGILWSPVAEGIEEVSSQVAENITDYCTGVTSEWKPFEGGMHSFVYGAGGGAQFSGVGAGIMAKNRYDKFNARRQYRKAKEGVKSAFPDETETDTFLHGLTYMSPAEQEAVIGNMARGGNVSEGQLKKVIDFAKKANDYKAYMSPEAKAKEREASREAFVQAQMKEFDERIKDISNESGKIQQVTIAGNEEAGTVYIIKGEIAGAERENGFQIDVSKSSPELYYRDAEGNMQVVSPVNITVENYGDIAEVREVYENAIRESIKQQTEKLQTEVNVEEGKTIENGSSVIYTDEKGENVRGIVTDAFSSPEFVFLEDGTAVPRENVSDVENISGTEQPSQEQSEVKQSIKEQPTKGQPAKATERTEVIPQTEKPPEQANSYEIENGLFATKQSDGSMRLNVEYSKSELEKGQKLVERLNKDYEDYGQVFEMVPLPEKDFSNPLEKPKWGIVVYDKSEGSKQSTSKKIVKPQERKGPAPRFAEREKALGDYVSVRDEILRGMATGRFRFVWNDKDIRRGISKELGFSEVEKERRRRFWMFDNTGYSVDGLAHFLSESSDSPAYNRNPEDIRNEIIDIMNTYDTPTAMIEAAEAIRMSGEETRQVFFDNMTDEEREWYNQVMELEREFERQMEEDTPDELVDELLAQNITEKELEELQNLDEFINFEQVRRFEDGNRKESEPGADPAEIDRIESEGSNAAEVTGTVDNGENTGGSEEKPVPVGVPRPDAENEQRITGEVNAGIDEQITDLRKRLESKQKELNQKKDQIGKAFVEDKQLSLFEEKAKPTDELFQVDRDFSDKNLGDVFAPIQQEIKKLESNIRELEKKRPKVVNDALEADRKQGRLFVKDEAGNKEEISREDIKRCEADEQQKDMALDYLDGDTGIANKLAYLSIKNKIENDRNRSGNIERDSENRQTGTLSDTETIQPRLSAKRESGRSDLSGNDENSGTGGRELPDGGTRQADGGTDDNGPRDSGRINEFSDSNGSESSGNVSGSTSRQNDEHLDSVQSRRSRRPSGNGEKRDDSSSGQTSDSRRNDETSERTDHTESNRKAALNAELDAALSDFDSVLAKFKKAGKSDLSLSLVGLTNEQIETIGEIVAAGAKVGYVLLKKGAYAFQEWADTLKKYIGGKLKEAGLLESDIDELITSMWDTKVRDESGNRRKISELAVDYGKKTAETTEATPSPTTFQEKIRIALEKQKAAETIPVVVNDADNIRETLPVLLPEQQDDVIKAESRLFGKESKKGILFTNGTGTGKTFTGLGVIKRFAKQGRDNILIVVPSSEKVKDWSNDGRNLLLRITPLQDTKDGGERIVVTTYANFRENLALKKRVFDLIVYDECHRIMESKGGDYSTTTNTHFQISNKNESYALQRLLECDKSYQRWKEIGGLIKGLKEEVAEIGLKNKKEPDVKKKINVKEKQEKIKLLEKEREECEKVWKAKEPAMKEQAKIDVERTKVVFLSATPFKSVFNLRYADGYLFDFPKHDYVGYNVPTGENLFYIENFGAQFQMRYGRLETKGKDINPEAVSMQEIEFQQKLTNEGAMSGRAIESNMDYSREFIKPHSDEFNTELFNDALNAIFDFEKDRYNGLRNVAHKVFFSYHYSTRLMETLKTSMFIPRMDEHIRLGRKIVVFHRRKQADVAPPFAMILATTKDQALSIINSKDVTPEQKAEAKDVLKQCEDFRHEFAKVLQYERTLHYSSAIDQIVNHFGPDRVRLFNGDISKADKSKAVKDFNDDNSGVDIIVIQEESGKEGISLHDRSGKHQRVLISLSAPISSITALQIEGRIYRIGQESNAIFEYPTLGLDSEMILFSQTINRKLSTTENLALGDSARDLIKSFAEGIENWTDELPGEAQGTGGKEADRRAVSIKSPYEKAVLTYFTNQKKKGRRDQREGMDYFPTPEPLGQKLVEWTGIRTGEWLLEPSAGHGAIAMWIPANCGVTAIEPSLKLYARLGGKVTNGVSKILNTTFEDHDLINKYDVVAMNPPFGAGGALAIAHIEKAFKHLRNGGRLVAIVPNGGSMEKKVDKFLYGVDNKGYLLNPEAQLTGEIILPGCTFEQAGTTVYCRVLVIDKVGEGVEFSGQSKRVDLSYCKDINEFFDVLEGITMLPRPEVTIKEEKVTPEKPDNSDLALDVEKTKHTKTDEDLFVVKLSKKVEYEEFKGLKGLADKHDGYWSRFTNGFTFKTLENAEKYRQQVNSEQEDVRHREKGLVDSVINPDRNVIENEIGRLEKSLGVRIQVVEGRKELPEAFKGEMKESSRYPGMYSVKTGEVYVVRNEITDVADAQRTILHEVVGHKGLRGMLGDKFDDFCEEVLRGMKEDEKESWIKKYEGNRQLAAEEYVASFAEEYRDLSAWEKVKADFREVLRKVGIRIKLSDGDLKYLLWKGVHHLKSGDTALDVVDKAAKDMAMFREVVEEKKVIDAAEKIDISNTEKLKFHNEIASRKFKFVEAYQDRMLAVKKLQELIESKTGQKLPSYMNTYLFENTLASRNTYEIEHFRNNELRRMTSAIAALEKRGLSRRQIENYVIAKHGLERNEYIRQKKVMQWYQPQLDELERQRGKSMSEERYQRELMLLDAEKEAMEKRLANMDFSGLKAVAGELKNMSIEEFIEKTETDLPSETAELWAGIKVSTDLSLRKWFEAGMMNRQRYDKVRGMFKNYIPLRGFDETIASDVYEYFEEEDHRFNSPLRVAKGRTSRADNPFAYIVSLVESSIVGGNKNLMKLHLLRMAQKYPSNLMNASRMWYQEVGKDAEGNPQYEILLPVYDEDAEQYRQNVEEFNKEMQRLEGEEKVFRSRSKLKTGYRLLYEEPQEHTVKCCLNGEPYAVLLHGDPRAAQAVEGLNDEERIDNKVITAVRWMNRQMAANFTTRNPAFVASNLTRDLIFSISTLSVKENGKYRNRFVRNIYPASGAIRRYLKGKADKSNRTDQLFEEFLKHGGETGYTALYNIERFKKMIDNAVKETRRNQVTKTGMKILDFFAAGNRWAEDLSRFSVYLTSRQMGRSVLESVHDAKEVTVNFNKKGSGALGAQVFKSLYLFFNAAVQSMSNFYQMSRKNPRGTSIMMTGYAMAGMLVPFLLQALGGDDAEEEYLNLPDYIRKNNLCVWLGGKRGFITLPLPIELRAFFSMGDAAYRYLNGRIDGLAASGEAVLGMLDVLPLSPTGDSAPLVPDPLKPIAQAFYLNKDFVGHPIAKVTPYNQYLPEYRRVYRGTSDFFVKSSEVVNYFSGGDYATRGGVDKAGQVVSDLLNMNVDVSNPAAHEHLLNAYLGGMYKTVMQTIKTGVGVGNWMIRGDDSGVEARSIPVLNRFYNRGSEYSTQSQVNKQYFKCLDELKETESRLRQYQEAALNGKMDIDSMLGKYSELIDNGKQQRAEVIRFYSNEVNKLREGLNSGELMIEDKEELEQEILLLKKQMLEELKQVK